MKIKTIGIIVLVLVALGSVGCFSTNPRVYYLGDKAYAKSPETGKIMSWEYEASGRRGSTKSAASGEAGQLVCDILDCIVN